VLAGNVNSNAAVTGVTVTASGNLVGNNAVVTNDVSAATITASGNVLAGNVNSNAAVTGVTITASGNLVGNNAVITNDVGAATVTATGNVSGGNITTAGQVAATGNVSGGNIATAGQANLGNIRISGDTITGTNGQVLINSAGADVDFVVSGDTVANLLVADAGSDTVLISTGAATTGAALKIGTTDSILVPVGNSAQRPGTAVTGMVRFNTTLDVLEFYDSDSWVSSGADFTIIGADEFVGDNSTVAFTLSEDSTTAATIVAINGVVQIPVTAYSVSGNVLTFTEAPESTDVIDARILTTSTTVTQISNSTNTAIVETPEGGAVEITGNLIPTANVTYNLGAPDAAWDDLYVSASTIFLGNLQLIEISATQFGVFTADGVTTADLDVGNIDVAALNQGTSTIGIAELNGNAFITVGGVANVVVVDTQGVDITGNLSVSGDVVAQNVNSLSDATLKTNILPLTGFESVINSLTGVEYDWKNGSGHSYGLLAQDVEKVIPSAVKTDDAGLKSVNYQMIIPFLIETIKSLGSEINELKKVIGK
jgi:cytoskeletal protein CcmA (bactofilin family)